MVVFQNIAYNAQEKKDKVIGILKSDIRIKLSNHDRVSIKQKKEVIGHINSFYVVDFHYCLAITNKKYLDAELSTEQICVFIKGNAKKRRNLMLNLCTTAIFSKNLLTSIFIFPKLDLENMKILPKADVGCLFYKRKRTVYNLTGMIS